MTFYEIKKMIENGDYEIVETSNCECYFSWQLENSKLIPIQSEWDCFVKRSLNVNGVEVAYFQFGRGLENIPSIEKEDRLALHTFLLYSTPEIYDKLRFFSSNNYFELNTAHRERFVSSLKRHLNKLRFDGLAPCQNPKTKELYFAEQGHKEQVGVSQFIHLFYQKTFERW